MANRSYLYSLDNRPTSFADRPTRISGLSEWNYAVPFSFRVLASGDPQLCASLISDGFDDEPENEKTRLHAISSPFDLGFARLKRFFTVARALVGAGAPELIAAFDESTDFLAKHGDRYVLLETIELDSMQENAEDALRACVEQEIARCREAGAAIDGLSADAAEAGKQLQAAARGEGVGPLEAFRGLCLDARFDNARDGDTDYAMGLSWWTEVLYFGLWNKAEYEANQ